MTRLAFFDTETTGLDPDRHDIWEVGLILVDEEHPTEIIKTKSWLLDRVDLVRANPMSLEIGGFHQRHPKGWELIEKPDKVTPHTTNHLEFAIKFGRLTYGAHLIGAVPSFDEERLRKLFLERGFQPGWHYHPIDIEAMAAGWLYGRWSMDKSNYPLLDSTGLPLKSDELSRACGVHPPDEEDRHTALGDARWVHRWYCTLVGAL